MNVHERAIAEAEAQLKEHEGRYDDNPDGECPCKRCYDSRELIKVLKERAT